MRTSYFCMAIYFRYDRLTSANWLAISESGSTETSTDTGIAVSAGTEVDLQFVINSDATSVGYYIDDVLVATHTTNIPTANNLTISWNIIKSAGTTERKGFGLYYDYIQKRAL